jgi:hypothetical protein
MSSSTPPPSVPEKEVQNVSYLREKEDSEKEKGYAHKLGCLSNLLRENFNTSQIYCTEFILYRSYRVVEKAAKTDINLSNLILTIVISH